MDPVHIVMQKNAHWQSLLLQARTPKKNDTQPLTYIVFDDIAELASVATLCGGSDNVRYGHERPETAFVSTLELRPGDNVCLFVHCPGGQLATQTEWSEDLWGYLANHGIQTADCPTDVWNGPARFSRKENIPDEPMTFDQAIAAHFSANPGTMKTAEFTTP